MKYWIKIILIITGVIICGFALLNPKGYLNVQERVPTRLSPATPLRLSIESIGVHALIEAVGLLEDGSMGVPIFPNNVGWYNLGVRPGNRGSAVLAGHVNWSGGKDAVFTKLHLVEIGDKVSVVDDYGVVNNFIVRDIKSYPVAADTSEVFSAADGGTYLNLITCDGLWNVMMGTHESRLVVFTEKI